MEYTGVGLRLQPGDIEKAASSIGVTEAHLQTVIEVETSGKGFDASGHPTFLFEPHIFYRNVPKAKLAEAIKKGLAYPQWKGPGSYPKTPALRWSQFQQAVALDETAAIKSASWGLGQIMGSEYSEAGYSSPQEMLVAFCKSEYEQVQGMADLIEHRGLVKQLLLFPDIDACRAFAKAYNGAAYAKNNYHNKLHDAYVRWSSRAASAATKNVEKPVNDDTMRIGDYDPSPNGPIRAAQSMLKSKGYSILVDGKYGPGTRATVLAWQANNDMETTGELSSADIAFLPMSPDMPIPAERATATVEDLKPRSAIVQKTSLGKKILGWTGAGLGGAQVADSAGLLDKTQTYVDQAQQAKGIVVTAREVVVGSGLGNLLDVVLAWKFPILCVVVVIGFVILNKVQKDRLRMHQNAEIG